MKHDVFYDIRVLNSISAHDRTSIWGARYMCFRWSDTENFPCIGSPKPYRIFRQVL